MLIMLRHISTARRTGLLHARTCFLGLRMQDSGVEHCTKQAMAFRLGGSMYFSQTSLLAAAAAVAAAHAIPSTCRCMFMSVLTGVNKSKDSSRLTGLALRCRGWSDMAQ